MSRPLLALPAICALAFAGCAQGGNQSVDSTANYKGTEKAIAQTVENLQAFGEKAEGSKICTQLLTGKLSQQIGEKSGGKGCAAAVKDGMEETDKADLSVTKITIDPKDPNKATAVVKAKTGDKASKSSTMELAKESGRWRISSFG